MDNSSFCWQPSFSKAKTFMEGRKAMRKDVLGPRKGERGRAGREHVEEEVRERDRGRRT